MARSNAALAQDWSDEEELELELDEEEVGFVDLMDEDVELVEDDPSMHFDGFDMWFEDEPEPLPELSYSGTHAVARKQELAEAEVSLPLIVHRAAVDGHPCDAVQAFLRRQLPQDCSQEPEAASVILWARHELFLYISEPEEERDRAKVEAARKALARNVPQGAQMLKAWRTALRMIAETP